MAEHKIDSSVIEYIAEGKEIIDRILKQLGAIEKGVSTEDAVSSLYRDVHTLKGTSQLFGFNLAGQVSHALEACLDPVRKKKMIPDSRLIDVCIKSVGLLEKIISSLEVSGKEDVSESEIVKCVSQLVDITTKLDKSSLEIPNEPSLSEEKQKKFESAPSPDSNSLSVEVVSQDVPQNFVAPIAAPTQQESTIRVNVSLLDRILNLVGELVLVRNQLIQHRNRNDDPDFLTTSKNLDVVTSDLQGEIMKTRMQPIETVVGKFHRVVRDMAADLEKKIDLTLEGVETELDKSLLEAIKDPLTHIVRNCCDHGIETVAERKKINKPETGHILIRSYHEGGQVVIEVSDDGRGINRARVIQKALEKGVVSSEKAEKLTDREVFELIFLPGFSTSQHVTAVSGRGVGMDVVRTNVEKIGGNVEVKSFEGKGTSIQLRIPLTLAIVPALVVKSGQCKFAIPQVKLVELVRAESVGAIGSGVHMERLQGRPTCRLRGQLLPLYDIREITKEEFDSEYKDGTFIVVLSAEGSNFGLLVSEVLDTADIVVKPLSSLLNNLAIFSGATILGDGSIALILDVQGVAENGGVLSKKSEKEEREAFSKQEKAPVTTDVQEFLLFNAGSDTIHTLPLCLVSRLEEFLEEAIELSGDQRLVRYRGGLLPLINLSETLKYDSNIKSTGRVSVIVVQRSGRNYGFIVNEIVDVMTIEGQIDDSIRDRNGILGNLIHKDQVVVVIDALGIIEGFNASSSKQPTGAVSRDALNEIKSLNKEMKFKSVRVLYAEDVAFFRKHVSKLLAGAGIDITTVEDGKKALQELDASDADRYNLILSDIEMPNLNGLELAREIRKRERFKSIPIVALTTRFRDSDIAEGKAAGFNTYLEKLNPEKLLTAIQELMGTKPNEENLIKEVVQNG